MAGHAYEVYNPEGNLVVYAPECCRYPRETELEMLEAGYTIRLRGKKLTKSDIRKEARINGK